MIAILSWVSRVNAGRSFLATMVLDGEEGKSTPTIAGSAPACRLWSKKTTNRTDQRTSLIHQPQRKFLFPRSNPLHACHWSRSFFAVCCITACTFHCQYIISGRGAIHPPLLYLI